ncbi:MAG: ABC transporter ATP-binding protein [Sedimentibacter saalensis]|jgi:NitT/TauT family transport system ATP-binding protein|uniref:ABC transporter ATP-binding protein n=1 Tax=Sedimentibacter saalensis TaxID=130788 RepID=UPI002B20D854|nr:ABC transporter ATP-binding protein [Sedimentibacter saalensis]MEA5094803.1 ABC transporter ATP-binding protein [Sedimentibacter saalensis]
MIKLIDVTKKYDDMVLLKNFNISFEENEITCLFGPSGVGKTTIANIAANLVAVDEGIVSGTEDALYSYVFQEPNLLDWYSVYDNLDFVLKDIFDNKKRKEIIESYLKMVELSNYRNFRPKTLSGGMAQRVSIARAFAYPSNVLIMDEPFKGLDVKLKQDIVSLFKRLWKESRRTVIFITHDVDEAVNLSDKIYVIKNRPVEINMTIDVKNTNERESIKNILIEA